VSTTPIVSTHLLREHQVAPHHQDTLATCAACDPSRRRAQKDSFQQSSRTHERFFFFIRQLSRYFLAPCDSDMWGHRLSVLTLEGLEHVAHFLRLCHLSVRYILQRGRLERADGLVGRKQLSALLGEIARIVFVPGFCEACSSTRFKRSVCTSLVSTCSSPPAPPPCKLINSASRSRTKVWKGSEPCARNCKFDNHQNMNTLRVCVHVLCINVVRV